ncbi:hypothetical protein [Aneurinibacillus terranovensis]|uniref:hypothetical protein n=1 Tax=Aneurinibacillus terranovensis TaxID=278991 RepID=UPI0003FF0369|nr:hypothetical protein [Aneurinibacillus terranovensis]
MKNRIGTSRVMKTVFFVVMAGITLGGSYYNKAMGAERGSFSGTISEKTEVAVVDLANQGWPKYLLQPGGVSFSSGHKKGLTFADGKPHQVQIKLRDFIGETHVETDLPGFDEKTGKSSQTLAPQKDFYFALNLNIPSNRCKRYEVCSGTVQFIDQKTDHMCLQVPL